MYDLMNFIPQNTISCSTPLNIFSYNGLMLFFLENYNRIPLQINVTLHFNATLIFLFDAIIEIHVLALALFLFYLV